MPALLGTSPATQMSQFDFVVSLRTYCVQFS